MYDPRFGFFILLRQLAVADRWVDQERFYRLRYQWLCAVYHDMLSTIEDMYARPCTRIDVLRILPQLETFAAAIMECTDGNGVPDVVGFVDGKFSRTCRPGLRHDETMYISI